MAKHDLPCPENPLFIVGDIPKQRSHHGEQLCIPEGILHPPVHFLIVGLGGVGAPVEFQVQLSIPNGKISVHGIFFQGFIQLSEILRCRDFLHMRQSRNLVHRLCLFDLLPGGAAASVAETVGNQQFPVGILIPVVVPDTFYRLGTGVAVVSIVRFARIRSGDEMRRHSRTVNALPQEGIIGQPVGVVPADFGGHKGIHTGFLQDLRQRPGISEHIRQPEKLTLIAKLLAEEIFSHQNLTDDGLSGGYVAVALHPHGAGGFPASFLHPFFDMLVDIRIIFFDILIQLGLGLQENVMIVLFHQPVYGGERTGRLFSGMTQPPKPGHIDVGMSHQIHRHIRFSPAVHLSVQISVRRLRAAVKRFTARIGIIHQAEGLHQHIQDPLPVLVGRIQNIICLQRHGRQKIQIIGGMVQHADLCTDNLHLFLFGPSAAVQAGPEPELQIQPASVLLRFQEHLPVISIHGLIRFPVQIQQALKISVVPCSLSGPEIEKAHHLFLHQSFGNLHLAGQPVIPVPSFPLKSHGHLSRFSLGFSVSDGTVILPPVKSVHILKIPVTQFLKFLQKMFDPVPVFKIKWHTYPPVKAGAAADFEKRHSHA